MRNTKRISKIILGIFALSSIATATTLADDFMYVKAAHLNVRASGTIKSKVVAIVDSGYKVTVLDNSGKWKKVLLENGQVGYVNGGYLVGAEPYFEKVQSTRYTVKSGTAFLRGLDLERKVAVLNAGDVMEVTSEKVYLNKWIQVRVVDAKHPRYNERVGYIAKRLVTPIEGFVAQETIQEVQAPVEAPVTDESSLDLQSAPTEPVIEDTVAPVEETPVVDESTSEESDSADSEIEELLKGL